MELIPVLDILGNRIVRGIGGHRSEYRPIESQLTPSSTISGIASALREQLGFRELYVADLDAISDHGTNLPAVESLISDGFNVALDSGIRDAQQLQRIGDSNCQTIILALESLEDLGLLARAIEREGPDRILFSLDLKGGRPLWRAATSKQQTVAQDSQQILSAALGLGCRRFLFLDLADVGMGQGVSTLSLCRCARELDPDVEIWTGGGVRDFEDVRALAREPIDRLLVASALHTGKITASDLA